MFTKQKKSIFVQLVMAIYQSTLKDFFTIDMYIILECM